MGVPAVVPSANASSMQQQLWLEGGATAMHEEQQDCSSVNISHETQLKDRDAIQKQAGQQAAATLQIAAVAEHQSDQQTTFLASIPLCRAVWSSGVCCVLIAAFIFAVANVLVKLTQGRVPVLEITIIRSSISLAVSAVLIKSKNISPVMGHRRNALLLICRGVFGAVAMTSLYACILLLPLADGTTLFFLNPCITAVAAWAIRGEHLGLLGLGGCMCSLIGLVILVHPPMLFGGHVNWGPKRVWGTAFGLGSAICAAGAFIAIRSIGKSEPAIVVALYFHLSTSLIAVLPLSIGWPQSWQPVAWYDGLKLLGLAAGSFIGQLFMTRGLQLENASLMTSLNYSQVLYSYVFGILLFDEHFTLFGVLGSILVAVGVICVSMRSKDDAAQEQSVARTWTGPSLSERARRLGSLKRLLSLSSYRDDSQEVLAIEAERLPLRSNAGTLTTHALGRTVVRSPQLSSGPQQQQ